MNDWILGLSSHMPTDEEVLNAALKEMPVAELDKLAFDLDPLSFQTRAERLREKLAVAERNGRELAHENNSLQKIAFIPALLAGATRLAGALGGAKGIVGGVAKDMAIGTAANKVIGALKPAAPAASAAGEVAGGFKYAFAGGLLQRAAGYTVRNPGTALTAAGAVGGALMAPRDSQTGQKQYLRGAVMGGVGAAGVNAVSNGRLANKLRSSVMNRESPLLGQGTRKYLMDSAASAKGKIPGANGQYARATTAPVTPTAATSAPSEAASAVTQAPRVMAPEWQAAHQGVREMQEGARVQQGLSGMRPQPVAPAQSGYRGGPVAGMPKIAEQQFLNMSPAERILFVAGLEKRAFFGLDDVVGGAVGYSKGRQQAARGEEHTFGAPQVGSLILPGGAGYQIGRAFGHSKSKEKKANQQTLTYDPATKTFTRQHLSASPGSEAVQGTGAAPIPAGHTEMVRSSGMRPPALPGRAGGVAGVGAAAARPKTLSNMAGLSLARR